MKARIIALVIWTVVCCSLLGWMYYMSLQPKIVAGNAYQVKLLPGSYLVTRGAGTAELESCEFFSVQTKAGRSFGMYTIVPSTTCRISNQYAHATVALEEVDTITLNDGPILVNFRAAGDGVIWAEEHPTGANLICNFFVSFLVCFVLWAVVAISIAAAKGAAKRK